MRRRLAVGWVVLLGALATGVAVAPAHVTKVKTNLTLSSRLFEPGNLSIGGKAEPPANVYCAQRRKVEIFRDGVKVASLETDRYGSFTTGLQGAVEGTYVAKVKQSALPASMQHKPGKKHRIFCLAASSKPHRVPADSYIG